MSTEMKTLVGQSGVSARQGQIDQTESERQRGLALMPGDAVRQRKASSSSRTVRARDKGRLMSDETGSAALAAGEAVRVASAARLLWQRRT
jgi:hypothetical protein